MVEWDGLENRFTRKGNEGSNPSLSAHLTALSDRKILLAICRLGAMRVALFEILFFDAKGHYPHF